MKSFTFTLALITSAVLGFSWPGIARADDASVSSTPTGDLVFVKNDSIEMVSEDLTIAVDKVRVDYVFRNNSSTDITMQIGFPLPIMPSDTDSSEFAWRLPHDQSFNAWVDGRPITADTNIRIGRMDFSRDKGDPVHGKFLDLTREVCALGFKSTDVCGRPTGREPNFNSPDSMAKLRQLNLICHAEDEPHDETGPCWSVKKTYYWSMTFPAHRDVSIRHEYKPWKGSYPDISLAINGYCPDQPFKDAVEKLRKKEHLEEANVDFILKTAANWSGPIGSFTLRVDKQGASLVSFCPIPGLKLVRSGNMFVGTAKDFTPQSDISIYFLGRGISVTSEFERESNHQGGQ